MTQAHNERQLSTTDWISFSGFFDRVTCCTAPNGSIDNLIILEDDDDVVDLPQPQTMSPHKTLARRRWVENSVGMDIQDWLSPSLSPTRRQIDPWDLSQACFCTTPSFAGSTATTASMQSEDEDLFFKLEEEIRSNATTEVVSHRNQALLSTTLKSARNHMQRRTKRKIQPKHNEEEEERAYRYLLRSDR